MKTKNIFKTLAFAMLMPAMMLTTACSNDDDLVNNTANTEPVAHKGYALPVTVSATRQGDKATTRATYNDNGDGTGSLGFSVGDKLFVSGSAAAAGSFAGALDYVPATGKFSGTIYTQKDYDGTADALFSAASSVRANLLPAGYESYNFLYINNKSTDVLYDDVVAATVSKAFVASETAKKTGVEQLSWEQAYAYNSGFALAPANAVLNFTISGLEAGEKAVTLITKYSGMDFDQTMSGSVTPNASGVATFAIGVPNNLVIKNVANNLTVGSSKFTLPGNTALAAGKIYNIARSATGTLINLANVTENKEAQNGDILTGKLANNVKISIADGATVILNGVSINADGTWTTGNYAGITCEGDATIILSGTNTVKGFYEDYPGIYVPVGNTVTIQGSGSLTASSNGYGAGIGGGFGISCGNIEIQGGVITTIGGSYAAGIGAGSGVTGVGTGESICGTITISGGTVTATGGEYAAGIGSGYAQTNPSTCGAISISGGTVSAKAGALAPAAIGKGNVDSGESTCASVTITPGITSLTLTNTNSGVTGIVSDFINAGAFNADTNPITYMLPTSVTDPTITGGMDYFGFTTSYNEGAKTWTITKK